MNWKGQQPRPEVCSDQLLTPACLKQQSKRVARAQGYQLTCRRLSRLASTGAGSGLEGKLSRSSRRSWARKLCSWAPVASARRAVLPCTWLAANCALRPANSSPAPSTRCMQQELATCNSSCWQQQLRRPLNTIGLITPVLMLVGVVLLSLCISQLARQLYRLQKVVLQSVGNKQLCLRPLRHWLDRAAGAGTARSGSINVKSQVAQRRHQASCTAVEDRDVPGPQCNPRLLLINK